MSNIYLGVDGYSSGWVSVEVLNKFKWKITIFPTIRKLWDVYSDAKLILIDIPIGLRDKGSKPRLCDIAARKFLTKKRSSSIFPTPCRSALYAPSYILANQINRKMTGKGLSKQTWNITNKIREVDTLLRNDANARQIIVESHPELCFTVLAHGNPMEYYKKTEEGVKERLSLIRSYRESFNASLDDIIKKLGDKSVDKDDILDACILAISAAFGTNTLKFIPSDFEYDSVDLPMRMAIPSIKTTL